MWFYRNEYKVLNLINLFKNFWDKIKPWILKSNDIVKSIFFCIISECSRRTALVISSLYFCRRPRNLIHGCDRLNASTNIKTNEINKCWDKGKWIGLNRGELEVKKGSILQSKTYGLDCRKMGQRAGNVEGNRKNECKCCNDGLESKCGCMEEQSGEKWRVCW